MLAERLRSAGGLLRSLVIYRGLPWRRRALVRFYRDIVPADALVFDIGAHVGSRTATLLRLGARCVALEPQPLFLALLNASYGNDPRVTVVGEAVGQSPGRAVLNVSRRHPTVSTLSTRWIGAVRDSEGFEQVRWDQQVEVAVTTLDVLIAQHGLPDFCKIDVEGMEYEILCGLTQPVPLLAFEYLPAAATLADDCVRRLCELGHYHFNLTHGEAHRFVFDTWVDAATLRDAIREHAARGGSGDVYARL